MIYYYGRMLAAERRVEPAASQLYYGGSVSNEVREPRSTTPPTAEAVNGVIRLFLIGPEGSVVVALLVHSRVEIHTLALNGALCHTKQFRTV